MIAPPLGDNTQTEPARPRNKRGELHRAQTAVGLRALSGVADSPSTVLSDSTAALEPPDSTGGASLITLPPVRMQVNARGLALGVLAALATVFALSWAQTFLIPLLLGIVISYTVNPS